MRSLIKKSLIVLFLLLTTTNTFAQYGWATEKNTGGKYYIYKPKLDRVITWTGKSQNGFIVGYGTLEVYYKGELSYTYVGYMLDGKENGTGKFTEERSYGTITYEGEWKDGKRHGQGKRLLGTTRYEGEWVNGDLEGYGVYDHPSHPLKKYEGNWKEGEYHGYGKLFLIYENEKYEGNWKEGKRHGQGTYTFETGRKVSGTWKEDWLVQKKILGKFTDGRDGETYQTAKIGNQIWMAENLVYEPNMGNYKIYPHGKSVSYDWETAQNVCPSGWHLPSDEEFRELEIVSGDYDNDGNNLKSIEGWKKGFDLFGFNAKRFDSYWYDRSPGPPPPGGFIVAGFWSKTKFYEKTTYWYVSSFDTFDNNRLDKNKTGYYPVRCIKN